MWSPYYSHFFCVVTKSYCSSCTYITHFEIKRILREKQNVRRLDISVCDLWFLKMCKYFYHGRDKHKYVFFIEILFSWREVGFEIGNAFFHLDVASPDGIYMSLLLLQDVATLILNDSWMRVGFDFRE